MPSVSFHYHAPHASHRRPIARVATIGRGSYAVLVRPRRHRVWLARDGAWDALVDAELDSDWNVLRTLRREGRAVVAQVGVAVVVVRIERDRLGVRFLAKPWPGGVYFVRREHCRPLT